MAGGEDEDDRRAVEVKRAAQGADEIGFVSGRQPPGLVDEQFDADGLGADLGGVVELQSPAFDQRRLHFLHRVAQHPVHQACWHLKLHGRSDAVNGFDALAEIEAVARRGEEDRHGQEGQYTP